MSRARSSRRVSIAVAVGTLALALAPALNAQPAFAAATTNLLKNPGAERGTGSTDGSVVPVSGWIETNGSNFTEVQYGATGGFPTSASPGPADRGHTFFAGGPEDEVSDIVATQTVKLKPYAAAIKHGHVTVAVQGYLGGMGEDNDQALVEVDFKDKDGFLIGDSVMLAAVTATDRNNVTGLLKRSATGAVPAGAKSVYVQLILERLSGSYDNAYADNLSLVLKGV